MDLNYPRTLVPALRNHPAPNNSRQHRRASTNIGLHLHQCFAGHQQMTIPDLFPHSSTQDLPSNTGFNFPLVLLYISALQTSASLHLHSERQSPRTASELFCAWHQPSQLQGHSAHPKQLITSLLCTDDPPEDT